jgi:hypothetical protein
MSASVTLLAMTTSVKIAKLGLVNSWGDSELLLAMGKLAVAVSALPARKHPANCSLRQIWRRAQLPF